MTQAQVLSDIDFRVNANGNEEITGVILNSVLHNMIENAYSMVLGSVLPTVVSPTVTITDDLKTILARIQYGAAQGTNGLESVSGLIGLGGTLVQNTTIDGTYELVFGAPTQELKKFSTASLTESTLLLSNHLGRSSASLFGEYDDYVITGLASGLPLPGFQYKVAGDQTAILTVGSLITIYGQTAPTNNNGEHVLSASVYDNINDVTVIQSLTFANIFGSPYGTITALTMQVVKVSSDVVGFRGLEYATDFSANYSARSLVDKAYADSASGNNLQGVLGNGNSTGGTDITDPSGIIKLTLGGFIGRLQYDNGTYVSTVQTSLGSAYLRTYDPLSGWEGKIITAVNTNYFNHTQQNTFNAPLNLFNGLAEYNIDYSSIYTLRSLVDKEYVDIAIASATPVLTLQQVVTNDNTVNGYLVKSNANWSRINVSNSTILFDYDNGTDVGNVGTGNSGNFLYHTSNNTFTAPLNLFDNGGAYFVSGIGIDTTATGGSDILNIGATNADIINIGRAGATVNILGSVINEYATNAYVTDKLITLNSGGAVASGIASGFEIEENAIITGYFKTNAARTGFSVLAPANSYYGDLTFALLTANRSYAFPDASGTLSLAADLTTGLALKVDKTNSVLLSYLEIPEQAAPGTPTNALRIFADTSNRFSWIGENGFVRTFDGTANTANRSYVLQDASGTLAFLSDITGAGTTELAAVISQTNTPPGSPATGDRYLVGTVPTGAWVGSGNKIAEWGGASWTYTTPATDNTVFVTATLTTLRYNGTSWVAYNGTAILHNGNTLGAVMNISTNDAYDIYFKRNNVLKASITATGVAFRNTANTFQAEFQNAITANRTITIPDATTTLVGTDNTQTLTNKTVRSKVLVVTQSATPATNIDNADIAQITGLAQAIMSMTTNLTGTPYHGQMILWEITDNGTARAITWGASFVNTSLGTLPTTTVISTVTRTLTIYNSATSKHECVG